MADKPTGSPTTFDKLKKASSSFSSAVVSSSTSSSSFSASATSISATMHRRLSNSSMPIHSQFMDEARVSMAPPPPPPMPSEEPKKSTITNLMSPPDAALDSFHKGYSAVRRSSDPGRSHDIEKQATSHQKHQQQPLPMSPPISPYSKSITTAHPSTTPLPGQSVKDPVLFPVDEHSPSSPPAQPLFVPAELEQHQKIVDEHVRARPHGIFEGVLPPRREDYELALTFRSQVMKHFTANPREWLRKERAFLEADRRAGAQRYHTIMPAKPRASARPIKQRVDRVSKPQATPRPVRTNATTNGTSTTSRPAGRTSVTPEPCRRVVAPNREDKDFNSIVDYCPPLDTLPDRGNSLKVDWKGHPIDLSNDSLANLLHHDELLLAGNLRLDCATYLTSKRRIFERRLQCLRMKKEFRKTDAQQACKIDVNKASKLWTAFEKVGWLDPRWISRFL